MTLSFGGGAGVLTIPGFTSDDQTPGGVVVAGAVTAGDPNAALVPTFHQFNGSLIAEDTVGNNIDDDATLGVEQAHSLTADSAALAFFVLRSGALNGHQYTRATVLIEDISGSTAPLIKCVSQAGTILLLGQEGGLGLFGHAAPTAPRTLAQATITAITDANAKAAVQACANTLADMGVLTLT